MTLPADSVKDRWGGSAQGVSELAGKYLTFSLGNEEFGISILNVREIIGVMEITAVPHTPPYIKGVINLRGRVIPVMDLRLRFGMSSKEYDDRTCVIVTEVQGHNNTVYVGMVVDSVSEVVNIAAAEIEHPPSMGSSTESENILGMAKVKDEVKILLDVNRIVGERLLRQFEEM